jgi:hypothetical protein
MRAQTEFLAFQDSGKSLNFPLKQLSDWSSAKIKIPGNAEDFIETVRG